MKCEALRQVIGGNISMKVYDSVKKEEVEVNGTKGLIDIMRDV